LIAFGPLLVLYVSSTALKHRLVITGHFLFRRVIKKLVLRDCMSSKVLPTLQGHRIKTRKRDEKEKFDPGAFRDSLLSGLSAILNPDTGSPSTPTESGVDAVTVTDISTTNIVEKNGNGNATTTITGPVAITKEHLEALYKYLDNQGNSGKVDYRKYGESLFDILIAGGILAPGGTIVESDASKLSRTELCVFSATDLDTIRGFANVVVKLIRRYKYLEKTLDEEFKKIFKFLKGFSPEERNKLAKFSGLLIAGGLVPPTVLASAKEDVIVKDGVAGDFLVVVLQIWLAEKDAPTVWSSMKKAGLDQKIMDFFPTSKRNADNFNAVLNDAGLSALLDFQKAGLGDKAKKELQSHVSSMIKDEASAKEVISAVKEFVAKHNMAEHEVVVLLWNTVMSGSTVEWSKKEELVADQALKHLRQWQPLFSSFTTSARSELALVVRIQDYCYENMNFLKVFQKIVVLFYKADVLSEDAILKWYKDGHSNKGKSVFLDQMKKFIEWLQNAEEESEEE